MRGTAGLVTLAACFTPAPPTGAPCDPVANHCPSGQRCVPGANGFVCSTSDGISTDAAVDAPIVDAPPDAPPGTIQRTYTAAVAECIDPTQPDPLACRNANGNAQLVIDLRDSTTNEPWHAYVRFDLDGELAGKTVTKLVLRLVVTNASNAPGPDSGSVFEVQPFTLASLSMTAPAKVGNAIAPSTGAVAAGDVVDFTLATPALARANSPVYLGLFPNDDDGVNYFNLDGAMPPRLIVDAQ